MKWLSFFIEYIFLDLNSKNNNNMSDIKMNILNSPLNEANEIDEANSAYFISRTNPIAYELDGNNNIDSLKPVKKRTVRLVYCGDGVVEECDEDDEEKERLEQEEKQRQIELQKQLDEQAVSFLKQN